MNIPLHYPHIASLLFEQPLAILQSKADLIVKVLEPYFLGATPQALAGEEDEEEEDRGFQITAEGIAVLPIMGSLVKRGGYLSALSGVTGYQYLGEKFEDAATDPKIKGILLQVDSPGGEVNGLFDLADLIFAARQNKPIWAVADDAAFSAAYTLASSASRVWVTRTGGVGSNGIIAMQLDCTGYDADKGLKYHYFRSRKYKGEGNPHEPLTDHAAQVIQERVDAIDQMLMATLGRNRNTDPKAIAAQEAQCYFGQEALAEGLADELGTAEEALAALTAHVQEQQAPVIRVQVQGGFVGGKAGDQRLAAALQAGVGEAVASMLQERSKAGQLLRSPAPPDESLHHPRGDAALHPEEGEMEKKDTPPAAGDPAGTKTISLDEARSAGRSEGLAYVREVNQLCALAEMPEKAAGFITNETPLAQVREALLKAKVKQDAETEQLDTHHPGLGGRPPAVINPAAINAKLQKQMQGAILG